MGTVKNALKKVLPPPVSAFNREVERILAAQEGNAQLIQQLRHEVESLTRQLEDTQKMVNVLTKVVQENQAAKL